MYLPDNISFNMDVYSALGFSMNQRTGSTSWPQFVKFVSQVTMAWHVELTVNILLCFQTDPG